jgi:GntR family transcriptional regulator/MocR family aminotransferase
LDRSVFALDRSLRQPLSDQIHGTLSRLIETGALRPGDRLPTTRELATDLSVNRGTVQAAYRKLALEEKISTRVGSGTVVRGPAGIPEFQLADLVSLRASGIPQERSPIPPAPLVADFSRLTPDERFFPLEDFTRTLAYTWSRRTDLWQYAPPLGLEELRLEICRRLAEHGIQRTADEILVTSGAQQGLDLLFRTFTDPGDVVAMESPTYPGALSIARFAGVAIHPLPMEPDGPDASSLTGRRIKLVYVMPERQNPTGITASAEKRRELVAGALAAGALVIEDGYEEPESGVPPLAASNPDRVVWLGTLSKDLVPGFRIGWIAAPGPVIELIARVKQTADFQTPLPLQAAVAAFLRAGADRKARRNRSLEVEMCRISAVRAFRAHLPELTWWGGDVGNPLFWLHLPEGVSGRSVSEAAASRGVAVAAGAEFDVAGEDVPALRMSVTRVDKRQIDHGIRLLAEAVREVQSRAGITRSMPVV